MTNRIKKLATSLLDRYLAHRIDLHVGQRLNDLRRSQPAKQLFYDVANFVVFNQIPGDYLEFGVHKGDGLIEVYHSLNYHWEVYQAHAKHFNHQCDKTFLSSKRFFAFDSFEGLPHVTSNDTPIHFSREGIYKVSLDSFRDNVVRQGMDLSRLVAVPGWFDKVLTDELRIQNGLNAACMVFIDCDLYESAVPVFRFLTDLVQDGTVIIIDDFFRYRGNPNKGIQRAFKEWLAGCPHIAVSELGRCSANRIAFLCHLLENDDLGAVIDDETNGDQKKIVPTYLNRR
jgi:O-methyltransferase